jgi:RNA-directed DNA polymerase
LISGLQVRRLPSTHSTLRDRVVQAALCAVLEPIFERDFAAQSYGFRPRRGCKDALRRVDTLLKQGYSWVVDADLKSYFDTIPHSTLMGRVREKVADGKVLRLLEAFLHARVMETAKGWTPDEGTPQGAVVSRLRCRTSISTRSTISWPRRGSRW